MSSEPARQALWMTIGLGGVVAAITLSLLPESPLKPDIPAGDKLLHALAYAALMIWFSHVYPRAALRMTIAAVLLAVGFSLEVLQVVAPGARTMTIGDILANGLGIVVGWILSPPRVPNMIVAMERGLGLR